MPALQFNKDSDIAYLFDGHGGASTIDRNGIAGWTPEDGTLWVHLNYSNTEDLKWLTESSSLDPLVVEALIAEETRPRATPIGDGLLICLRGVNLHPGADPEDMISIRLWIHNELIITTRKRDLLSVSDLIEQFNYNQGPSCSGEFLVDLIGKLVWRMSETVHESEDRVAEFEELALDTNSGSLKYELAILRRQAISIRRYLAPEREALTSASLLNSGKAFKNAQQKANKFNLLRVDGLKINVVTG